MPTRNYFGVLSRISFIVISFSKSHLSTCPEFIIQVFQLQSQSKEDNKYNLFVISLRKFLRKLFKTIQLFWNSFKGWRFHVLSQQSTALLKFLLHILLYMSLIFHFLQYYFRTILLWYLLFRISFYFFISSHIISF